MTLMGAKWGEKMKSPENGELMARMKAAFERQLAREAELAPAYQTYPVYEHSRATLSKSVHWSEGYKVVVWHHAGQTFGGMSYTEAGWPISPSVYAWTTASSSPTEIP